MRRKLAKKILPVRSTYSEQFTTWLTEGRLYVSYVKYCCNILEEFRSKCFKDVDVHTTPKYWHDLTQYSLFWKWHWTNTLWGCRSHNERYQFDHNKGYQFDPIQSSILQKDILLWKKYFVAPPQKSKSGSHLNVTAKHFDQCTKSKIMFFILQVLSSQIGIYAYSHRGRTVALKKRKLS